MSENINTLIAVFLKCIFRIKISAKNPSGPPKATPTFDTYEALDYHISPGGAMGQAF